MGILELKLCNRKCMVNLRMCVMRATEITVPIPGEDVHLGGELSLSDDASGLVLFAHGSGSSRHSPRNQFVSGMLREAGVGTMLFDLMTAEEEQVEARTRHLRF